MKLAIIIPTYNEKENISIITEEITKELKDKKIDYSIIIVDDKSPDGTGEIAENLSEKNRHIFVINRESKLGIGGAYIEGFKFALKNLNSDLYLTMDADLSHDPKYIFDLVKASEENDVIIGSRYVNCGGIINWGIIRIIISKGANILTKKILGLKSNDCTSGFKCIKKEVIEKLDFSKISSRGYPFIIEFLYYCKENGFKIKEVPIIFINRKFGKSKISKKEMYETFKLLIKLKLKNLLL